MSLEIDSVITSAMESLDSGGSDDGGADIGDSGDGGDTSDTSGTDLSATDAADAGTDAGTEGVEAGDGSGQPAEPSAADVKRLADEAAFDAELAELGLSAPKPGQRDNRIPYSRIRKIVANAKTKWSEKLTGDHKTELTAREQKIQEHEAREKTYAAAERLIESDPDRYMEILGTLYPKLYKGYAKGDAARETPQQARAKKDPEPQADIKYDDGSYGFSPEQFSKLREWDRREAGRVAKEESTKEFNERIGPMEQEWKANQQEVENVRTVRGHIGKLRDQFGADIIDNQDVQKEIIAYMDANPNASLVTSTTKVVMNRLQADRNKMRTDILAEQRLAPKAAAKVPAAPVKSDAAATSESIDDIIAKAMKGLK